MNLLTQNGETLLVTLPEEIDHHSTRVLADKIDRAIMASNITGVVFDFTSTRFMDSSGIGLLVGRYRKLNSLGGQISIQGMNPHMTKILQLSGIEKIIGKYEGTKCK